MLAHPKSTVCVLRMLMHLSAGHVTLLQAEFHFPPKFLPTPIGLKAPGGPTLGLAPNF